MGHRPAKLFYESLLIVFLMTPAVAYSLLINCICAQGDEERDGEYPKTSLIQNHILLG